MIPCIMLCMVLIMSARFNAVRADGIYENVGNGSSDKSELWTSWRTNERINPTTLHVSPNAYSNASSGTSASPVVNVNVNANVNANANTNTKANAGPGPEMFPRLGTGVAGLVSPFVPTLNSVPASLGGTGMTGGSGGNAYSSALIQSSVTGGASSSSPAQADAFLNMGAGPYPLDSMVNGTPAPWYQSPVVSQVFGGTPTAAQQQDFTNLVLSRVAGAFERSGVPVQLTADPNVTAAHTMSLVSGANAGSNSGVVGLTQVGYDGFTFADNFSNAKTADQLGWALANNMAHELMHAFGVDHHDTTGAFLDSGLIDWGTLSDPNAHFSPAAVADLLSKDFRATGQWKAALAQTLDSLTGSAGSHASGSGSDHCTFCRLAAQELNGSSATAGQLAAVPVPEPAAWVLFSLIVLAIISQTRTRLQKSPVPATAARAN